MGCKLSFFTVTIISIISAGLSCRVTVGDEKTADSIESSRTKHESYFVSKSYDKLLALFPDDIRVMPSNMSKLVGPDAFIDWIEDNLTPKVGKNINIQCEERYVLSPNYGIITYTFNDGTDVARGINLFQKKAEDWYPIREIFNERPLVGY